MKDEEIQRFIDRLEAEIPKEGAKVRLREYGGGPDESEVWANKAGYLRLGLEFLKAAYEPPTRPESSGYIPIDIRDLCTPDSNIILSFERYEEFPQEEPYVPTFKDHAGEYLALGVLLSIPVLAIVGLATVLCLIF
jgi:hypothetical protein